MRAVEDKPVLPIVSDRMMRNIPVLLCGVLLNDLSN